jgi:hypothetical protein
VFVLEPMGSAVGVEMYIRPVNLSLAAFGVVLVVLASWSSWVVHR